MDNTNGFRGAVPLGGAKAPTITCPWHNQDMTHPPDAPPCRYEDKLGQHVVEMAGLIFWSAVKLTWLLGASNGLAKHTQELQVQFEALEALLEPKD